MLVLVVDTATPAVTAAVVDVTAAGMAVLAARTTVDARAHGELLAPQIRSVLRDTDARPGDLTAVVAGTGPGPFTGLRVGLVTAATMGQALDVPTYGVCSLDALGAAGPGGRRSGAGGRLLVATDARRREIYWAVYGDSGARVTPPAVGRPAMVATRLAELGVAAAVGEGAHSYAEVLGVPVRDEPRYPPVTALAALAADRVRAGAPAQPLVPMYLRRPDVAAPGPRKLVSRP